MSTGRPLQGRAPFVRGEGGPASITDVFPYGGCYSVDVPGPLMSNIIHK